MTKSMAVIVLLAALLHDRIVRSAEPTARVTGRVTVEQTGAPVAGARVLALTGMSTDRPGRQFAYVETRTDEHGQYELPAPLGNVQLSAPEPPAGYWINIKPGYPYDEFVVTRSELTARHDFQVRKAMLFNARVTTSSGKPIPGVQTYVFQDFRSAQVTDVGSARDTVDAAGLAHFTVPAEGGKFTLGIADTHFRFFSGLPVTLDVPAQFDPTTATISAGNDSAKHIELVDRAGRKAVIEGAAVVMHDGLPQVLLVADELGPEQAGELRGQVVDQKGQPIEDALVFCIAALPPPSDLCRTDAQGRFQFRGPIRWMPEKDQPPTFGLMALKDGFVGLQTKYENFTPDRNGVQQLEKPLALQPGYSAPLRILDTDGQPVEGAWIKPGNDFATHAQFAKSDANGLCTLRNLPLGLTRLDLRYGDRLGSEKVVVSASSSDEPAVSFRLSKKPSATEKPPPATEPKPLRAGEAAPEWSIAQWSDGQPHALADFRDEVLVIDFWGVWCGPCVNAIPVIKRLEEKYAGQVKFVALHTAGTDMSQVKKLLVLKEWHVLVAIDKGPEIINGETVQRYNIRGFPSVVIVDRHGRIAFNSGADESVGDAAKVEAKVKALAAEIGLPWPIDKDVSEEELLSRLQKIQERLYSKEIDQALAN